MSQLINDVCLAIVADMEATWQRLPVSHKFNEPIPIQATVSSFQKKERIQERSYDTTTAAIADAMQQPSPILVSAKPGAGKTSAMRWFARSLALARAEQRGTLLPVYVDLGQVGQELPTGTLAEILEAQLQRNYPTNYSVFASERNAILFILDGLDILSGPLSARQLLDQLRHLSQNQFVLAGRTDSMIEQVLDTWPSSTRITLGPLDKKQREMWFRRWAPVAAESKYHSIVRANPHIESLLDTPLLFAMTASACIDARDQYTFSTDDYSGKTGIFSGFVQYATKRAIWQGHLTPDDESLLEQSIPLLSHITLQATRLGHRDRLPKAIVPRLVVSSDSSLFRSTDWNRLRDLILATGILEATPETYRFLHQQFAEYFAGLALSSELSLAAKEKCVDQVVAVDLQYRERDPIVTNAIAVVASWHNSQSLLDEIFKLIVTVGVTDACELFSATASPRVVDYLVPIPGNERVDPLVWLSAVQGLANIPHERAVQALCSVVTNYQNYQDSIVKSALAGLRKSPMRSARESLTRISQDSGLPAWLIIAAIYEMDDDAINSQTLDLAKKIVLDSSAHEQDRANAADILARIGNDEAERTLQRLQLSSKIPLALKLNIQSALTQMKLKQRSEVVNKTLETERPLFQGEFAEILWILQTSSQSQSHPATPTSLNNIADWAPRVGVNAMIENFLANPSGDHNAFVNGIIQLCTKTPQAWDHILAHPSHAKIPSSILQSAARVAGRRWIPWGETESNAPTPVSVVETPVKENSREEWKDREYIVFDYLEKCRELQETATLVKLADFAKSIGSPWARSTLASTKAWKGEMAERKKAKEELKRKLRNSK